MKLAVLGDGAMGTACAMLLASKRELSVTMWSRLKETADELRATRENKRFLPGVTIPSTIAVESDLSKLADSDAFIVAIPTVYLRNTLSEFKSSWPSSIPVISVAKGIEQETFHRPTQIIADVIGTSKLATLTGPSHAEELARGMPASVVCASNDSQLAESAQRWFSSETFRVYTSNDLIGAELCGALKNVIAIAAGICDGLKLGDNAKSALMTRGLVEMRRFGSAFGARPETFLGLAGVGDLITTCISQHGRNRKVGELVGQGKTLDEIRQTMYQVAEGVWTCRSVAKLARERSLNLPIIQEVNEVLFEGKSPQQAVSDLMNRDPRPEWLGSDEISTPINQSPK